jgi:hypothetical protein
VPILLQKSFWGDDRTFSGPLMRFARGDMRDHIVSHKNDHGASCWRYGRLQWRSRLKINICEIFRVVRFSTFATISANNRLRVSAEDRDLKIVLALNAVDLEYGATPDETKRLRLQAK